MGEKYVCIDCIEEEEENGEPMRENEANENSEPVEEDEEKAEVEISSRRYSGYLDSQKHQIMFCRANSDLRAGKNIQESENDCVTFFSTIT